MPKTAVNRMSELLASVNADLFPDVSQMLVDNSVRVERILLDMVRPDPVQPRRVLPEALHTAFHQQRLTPTQALKELVQMVQVAARQRGRPFQHVLELLPNPDDEREADVDVKLSPEEALLRDLVNLAITIRDDGQVNPLTVVDVSQGVARLYRIETGERRYWASWLVRDFLGNYTGDGLIPCIVVPASTASPFRQAKENTSRSGLNAMAMARQVALLLLHVHGYPMPDGPVTHDFYRQALDLDLRGKREYTEAVYSALGGISRQHFQYFKALLNLGDEAAEMADRHNLEEGKLRYVVQLEQVEEQVELIQQIIQHNLTVKQIKDIVEKGQHVLTNLDDLAPRSAVQIAKCALKPDDDLDAVGLVQAFSGLERDKHVSIARMRHLQQLLEEAVLLLEG
jgi:hypothetical protein